MLPDESFENTTSTKKKNSPNGEPSESTTSAKKKISIQKLVSIYLTVLMLFFYTYEVQGIVREKVGGLNTEWFSDGGRFWFWAGVAGSLLACFCLLATGLIFARIEHKSGELLQEKRKNKPANVAPSHSIPPSRWTFWAACRYLVVKAYDERRFGDLALAQMGLRALFSFLVLATASAGLLLWTADPLNSHPVVQTGHLLHIIIGGSYALFMAISLGPQQRRLGKCSGDTEGKAEDEVDKLVGPEFWRFAWCDMVFICGLLLTDFLPNRHFHLACILPMMGIWLFLGQIALRIFVTLVVALVVHMVTVICLIQWVLPGDDPHSKKIPAALWEFVIQICFWVAFGLILVIMRQLRQTAGDHAKELRKEKASAEQARDEAQAQRTSAEQARNDAEAARGLADAALAAETEQREQAESARQAAERAHVAAETANKINHAALEKEILLRKALQTLGTQRKHAVFAKDTQRRFIFANEILLEQLAPFAKDHPEWEVVNGRVLWKCIENRTDEYVGIDCDAYRDSDHKILKSKSLDDDHYDDFEPSFRIDEPEGTMIWTTKEAIREEAPAGELGRVIGLVGYAVNAFPVEMQKMYLSIVDSLPMYAAMKNKEGHIVWANEHHLKKLEPKLDELLKEELKKANKPSDWEKEWEKIKGLPRPNKLKRVNGGLGPTDKDLYGPEGEKYFALDMVIIREAELNKDKRENFDEVMEKIIKNNHLEKDRGDRDEHFPQNGWMEYHRFPGADHGVWVEVRKMPWWEDRLDGGKLVPHVKGVLVFFEDKHKTYLRKSVVWRWIEYHLGPANEAQVDLLDEEMRGLPVSEGLRLLARFRLPRLFRRMLRWMRAFVDGTAEGLAGHLMQRPRKLSDFTHIARIIEKTSAKGVKLDCDELNDPGIHLERHGDDLFVILTALAFNAIAATEKAWSTERDVPAVKILFEKKKRNLVFTVVNGAGQISEAKAKEINELEGRNDDLRPGGGFFVAMNLALFLGQAAKKAFHKAGKADLRIRPGNSAAEVVLDLPMEAFRKAT